MNLFRYRQIACLVAAVAWLLTASVAQAVLSPHLDVIGWDEIRTDPRFADVYGAGQAIAVLDTGIDPEHLMFDDGLGGTRVVGGENYAGTPLASTAPPDYSDGNTHGTFVASISGGSLGLGVTLGAPLTLDQQLFNPGDTIDIPGVAPTSNLLALRVLGNDGSGSFDNILSGLQWVSANHAAFNIRAVNLSLGTTNTFLNATDLIQNSALAQAISNQVDQLNALGIPVIAAAGNTGDPTGLAFPAVLDNVISVGASRYDNDGISEIIADFTNRSNNLHLVAPGVDILGGIARDVPTSVTTTVGYGSGTSFATPQVAAAVLLINEVYEDRWGHAPTVEEILMFLTSTRVMIFDDVSGETFPRLDLWQALDMAYTIPEPTTIILLSGGVILLMRRRACIIVDDRIVRS